jgi:prepilin peptidase CpaA
MWTACLFLYAIVTAILLLLAAWHDIASRLIPNWICLDLAIAGTVARLFLAGPGPLAISLAIATGVFTLLLIAHSYAILGGADVKLLTALTFGLPPIGIVLLFASTALAGGLLALTHLVMRRLPPPRQAPTGASILHRIYVVERWRVLRHGPLPYAVAIACGGIWTVAKLIGA